MTKRNRFLSVLLSIFHIASCSTNMNKVSIFIYDLSDTFINSLTDKLTDKLTDEKIPYVTYNSNRSQLQQNKDIVDSIERDDPSLLLINPVDRLSAYTTMEKAIQRDIPIIFFNREPLISDMDKALKYTSNLYFVGTNATSEGEKQAEMVQTIFQDPLTLNPVYDHNGDNVIQMIMLKGEIGNQDTENRSLSFLSSLKRLGFKIELLDSIYCDWKRDEGYSAMAEVYAEYKDNIELVVSNNDDMALGAIDYLLDQEIIQRGNESLPFEFIGVDGIEESFSYIKDGLLYGTIMNDAEIQSDAIMDLALKILAGEPIDDTFPYSISDTHSIYIEGKAITKDDIARINMLENQ